MLRPIESILSFCCCMPTVDVDDIISNVDSILKELSELPEERAPAQIKLQKEYKKEQLEKAYKQVLQGLTLCHKTTPDKKLALRLGDILRQYGRLCYEESPAISRQILLAALNTQLYAIGLIDECIKMSEFHSMEDLKKQGAVKPNLFKFMDDLILTTHQDRCLSRVWASKEANLLPPERLFILASTLRWVGHCYQNMDSYLAPHPINDRRFEQLYYLCEAILLLADNDQSRKELAELYYNAWPFMHGRKYPDDIEGRCAVYDKCLAYNSEPEMRARVANIRFIILSNAGETEKSTAYLKEAMAIREGMPEDKQNGYLLANLRNNYAAYLMELPTPDLEEAEKYTRMAISYSSACRSHGEDHLYYAIYDARLAKILHQTGRNTEALEVINRAIDTLNKYPESNKDLLENSLNLKSSIINSAASKTTR